jgi:hypothetical protein
MLAVKGTYRDGQIELLEPIPDSVTQADLHIIVVPKDSGYSNQGFDEFSAIARKAFFETDDDKDINWNDFFGLAEQR